MRVEFEGQTHEFPDDFSPEEISGALGSLPKQFRLFSAEGAGSALKLVGPGLARGILGLELAGMEEAEREEARIRADQVTRGVLLTPEQTRRQEETIEGIRTRRQAIKEADIDIARIRGEPSKPLEIAQSVVQSVAANLPGVAAAVATRPAGPIAAAPALLLAGEQAFGQEFATARVGKDASLEAALAHARVSGVSEAAFELLPLSFLIKNLGKGGAVEFVTRFIARELATELPTTATQKISERIFIEPDKPLSEFLSELTQELIDTALVVPFAAGATGAIARGIARTGQAGRELPREEGVDKSPLTPPFDQPTAEIPSQDQENIRAIAEAIDPDLITDEQLEQARQVVTKADELKKSPPLPGIEGAWEALITAPVSPIEDIGELGASAKQTANAPSYINPNIEDRMDRVFSFGPEEAVGRTPRQVVPKPTTYVLGTPSEDRPADYLGALRETVEEWRQRFMPDAMIILSNEQQFSNSALGWHYSVPGSRRMHFIVPAVLRSPTRGLGAFNANAQASAFFNATHEFGHALMVHSFFGQMTPEAAAAVREQSATGVVSPEIVAQLEPATQAVVQEYNVLKQGILDNTLTAQQFVERWYSPAKLGRKTLLKDLGVAPDDTAMAVAKAVVRRAVQNSRIRQTVGQMALRRKLQEDFLSLDEYLAEQMSRHAYTRKFDISTPLGKFFSQALQSLREALQKLFSHLKGEGYIQPGTAFSEWLDGLSQQAKVLDEAALRQKAAKSGKVPVKAAKAVKAAKPKAVPAKKKVEKVQHNIETTTGPVKAEEARKLVANLVRNKVIAANDEDFKRLLKAIREEDFDTFIDEFQRLAGRTVKFELDEVPADDRTELDKLSVLRAGISEIDARKPEILADAAREWQEKQFRSKYVKTWFGDWENDAENASKVVTPHGFPLPAYHFTWAGHNLPKNERQAIFKFGRGDVGFHFGTVRAVHTRGTRFVQPMDLDLLYQMFETDAKVLAQSDSILKSIAQDAYIIPAILNIRRPLYLGEEEPSFWQEPADAAFFLEKRGVITPAETQVLLVRIKFDWQTYAGGPAQGVDARPQYDRMTPIRELLVEKGYDGIVYENAVEGDTSFVAFHPNQIKSLLSSRTFSRSDNLHMELDYDQATPEGDGASRMFRGTKNFLNDPGPLRRALRRVQHLQFHTLELQQLAHLHPDVSELDYMVESNVNYNSYKSRLQAKADQVVQQWKFLGEERFEKVNKFLFTEAEGGKLWFDLKKTVLEGQTKPTFVYQPNATTLEELRKRGIDPDTEDGAELATLILNAKNVLLDQLNEAEVALISVLEKRYAGASIDVLKAAILPVKKHIQDLRKFPFFPQGRFGNMMLTVEKKREGAPGFDVIYREAFEKRADWETAWSNAVAKAAPDERVRKHELSDTQYVLMALPTDFVDLAASELGLTDEQVEQMLQILQPVKKEKALNAFDQARLGIKGFSSDALRSFSNFTWHNANLLAKLTYRAQFNLAIRNVGVKLRAAQFDVSPGSLEEVERLTRVKTFMERARDYIMAPPNEAQAARAFVAVAYLGLNTKTALVNAYGLITTWSDITTRFGQIDGNWRFWKAFGQGIVSMRLTNLNDRREGSFISEDAQAALDRALQEGVLSQSYAYHLAGMANAPNLQRLYERVPGGRIAQRGVQLFVDTAMWPFRLTELTTRRVSFLVNYEAAKAEAGEDLSSAYEIAVRQTNALQNAYDLGNRVPFMRGRAFSLGPVMPFITIFMSFAQHMAFHGYGGFEVGQHRRDLLAGKIPKTWFPSPSNPFGGFTFKIWAITLLLAGYEGLPLAENLIDVIEAIWRRFGGPKPIRQELREFVQSVDGDPQFWSRGLSHNIAGFDVSRSLGFGRLVPGTDVLARPRRDVVFQTGDLVLDMAGPAGGFIRFGLEAAFGNQPPAKAFERMPGGIGNLYVAYRWSKDGVRAPNGAQVTFDLETGKLRDLTYEEILGKALGFNPTIVSQNRQIRADQRDREIFWQTRRKMLLDDAWTAWRQKDRETQTDVKKAITQYNTSIPAEYKDLRITGADLARSRQTRQRIMRLEELKMPPQRRLRRLYKDVRESYSPLGSSDEGTE